MSSATKEERRIRKDDVRLVRKYFGNEGIGLGGYEREEGEGRLIVESPTHDRGYVFFYGSRLEKNHEKRMGEHASYYNVVNGRTIEGKFTDNVAGVSGFKWRRGERK